MSKILPHENITLETKLKSEEIYQILRDSTEPKRQGLFSQRSIFSNRTDKTFEGSVHENSFDFRRIIYYGNSFLPNVTGEIKQQAFGSEIDLKLRLPLFSLIFMIIWLSIVFLFFALMFLINGPILMRIVPSIMLVFGIGLFIIPFKIEARKVKNILKELLQAEIKNGL